MKNSKKVWFKTESTVLVPGMSKNNIKYTGEELKKLAEDMKDIQVPFYLNGDERYENFRVGKKQAGPDGYSLIKFEDGKLKATSYFEWDEAREKNFKENYVIAPTMLCREVVQKEGEKEDYLIADIEKIESTELAIKMNATQEECTVEFIEKIDKPEEKN